MLQERLKTIRKERKITQDEVSELLGVKRQTYSAYERGVSVPDSLTLKKLADYFQVNVDYFFCEEGDERVTARNEEEEKLLLLARRARSIPQEQRTRILKSFEENIDIYLEALGYKEK